MKTTDFMAKEISTSFFSFLFCSFYPHSIPYKLIENSRLSCYYSAQETSQPGLNFGDIYWSWALIFLKKSCYCSHTRDREKQMSGELTLEIQRQLVLLGDSRGWWRLQHFCRCCGTLWDQVHNLNVKYLEKQPWEIRMKILIYFNIKAVF